MQRAPRRQAEGPLNRMTPVAGLLLVLGSGCSAPAPDRALFVGKLQSEALSLAEPGEICRQEQARSRPAAAGMERVCVSNACGWSDARLRVLEPIAGSVPAAVVRLRSVLGEWCRPVFIGTTSDPVLVVTAGVYPQTGLSRFETYRLIEVAPGQRAFVPHPSSLSLEPWALDLRPLLKPIQPVSFESVSRVSDRERADLLRLPYVCQEGTELTYCKAVYVSDLKTAVRKAGL
jgi:hypothetical protein